MNALITGASSGIGREIAVELGRRGYQCVLVARRRERLERLAERLPYGAVVCPLDLAQPGSARKLAEFCKERELPIEVLINNAGFGKAGAHHELDLAQVTEMCHLNISTLSELCHLFSSEMIDRRNGAIMNVASILGYLPAPFMANYSASKAYVINLSLALAAELEPFGVTVTCLNPGPTKTEFGDVARGRPTQSRPFLPAVSAEEVARIAVHDMFAGSKICTPGLGNRLITIAARLLPMPLLARLVGRKAR